MKKKALKKLSLDKKVISNLDQQQQAAVAGGKSGYESVCYCTGGCATHPGVCA